MARLGTAGAGGRDLTRVLELVRTSAHADGVALRSPDGTELASAGAAAGADSTELPLAYNGVEAGTLVLVGADPDLLGPELDELATLAAATLQAERAAARHRRGLTLAHRLMQRMSAAGSLEEALQITVEELYEHSEYHTVTGTLADYEAREQVIVADCARTSRTSRGLRRALDEGLVGTAMATGELIRFDHAADQAGYSWASGPAIQSLLVAPVMVAGRCVAALELSDPEPARFSEEDEALARVAAEQLASVSQGLAERARSEQRAAQLELAALIGQAVSAAATPEAALETAAAAIHEQAGFQGVAATLISHDTQEQIEVSRIGPWNQHHLPVRRPLDEGVAGVAAAHGQQVLVDDAETADDPAAPRSRLATPIWVDGRVVAVIDLSDTRPHRFTHFDAVLMSVVCEHLAATWQSVALRAESEQRAARLALAAEVAKLVAEHGGDEDVLAQVARAIRHHTGHDVMLVRADHARREQVMVAHETDGERATAGDRRPLDEGLIGEVMTRGVQVFAPHDPSAPAGSNEPQHSLIVTPVLEGDRCLAAIGIRSTARLDTWDAVMMEAVAEHLTAALGSVRMAERAAERARQLSIALRAVRAMVGARTVDETLEMAVSTIFDATDYSAVSAVRADQQGGRQVLTAVRSRTGPRVAGLQRPIGAGMSGRVLLTGLPVSSGTIPDRNAMSLWEGEPAYESGVLVPVMVGDQRVATLEAYSAQQHRFDAQDEVLLQTVAEQVAVAARSAQLDEEVDRRSRRLALTAEIARLLADSTSVEEALDVTARATFETGHAAVNATLVLRDEPAQLLVADYSRDGESQVGRRDPLGTGPAGTAIRTGRQQLVTDCELESCTWPGVTRCGSCLCTPVMEGDRCVAVLSIGEPEPDQLDDQDAVTLQAVTAQLAASLRAISLREQSAQRARRLAVTVDIAREIALAGSAEDVLQRATTMVHESTRHIVTAGVMASPDGTQQIFVAVPNRLGIEGEGIRRPIHDGLTGEVLRTGKELVLDRPGDHQNWSWPPEWPQAFGAITLVPIIVEGRCVGTLEAIEREHHLIDEADVSMMRAVAEQIGAALRGVALREESMLRAQRMAVALEVAQAVADGSNLEEILKAAIRTIAESIEAYALSAYTAVPMTGEQECVVDIDRSGECLEGMRADLGYGSSGMVFTTARQLVVGDAATRTDIPAWIHSDDEPRYESILGTPVIVDGRVVATLLLHHAEPNHFDRDDTVLMQTVAEQVSAAVRRARLRDESEHRAQRMGIALEVATAVAAARTAEETIGAAVETIHRTIGAEAIAGLVADIETGEQVCVSNIDASGDDLTGERRAFESSTTGLVFRDVRQLNIADAVSWEGYQPWRPGSPFRSALVTPVMIDDRAVAAIAVYAMRPAAFDTDDEVLLRTIAEQVAAGLRGAGLRDQSERRAGRLGLALEVATAVAAAQTPDEVVRVAVETISRSIDADAFTAFVALPDEGQQECVIDIDREGASIAGRRLDIDRHTTGEVFRTGSQMNVHGDAFDRWVPRPGPAAGLLTPVFSDGRVSAVITVMRRTNRPFDPDDAVLMRTVAEQVGAALRGAELRAQSEGRARRLEALEQRQRALLNRLVRAQEQERSKVAGDLHDDTVQVLSACVLALDRVRRSIEDGKLDRASASLREVAALVSGAVERTRRMTFELRPAVLWEHGLAAAVSHLLASLERENPEITTALDSDHLPDRLDPTIETIAFRSISELLANVRTHAVATEVQVRLARLGGGLEFEVRDNGHGFELEPALERARSTDHLGLETVSERIDAAGGTIEIETAPGSGTRVVATLPAHAAPGVGAQPSW